MNRPIQAALPVLAGMTTGVLTSGYGHPDVALITGVIAIAGTWYVQAKFDGAMTRVREWLGAGFVKLGESLSGQTATPAVQIQSAPTETAFDHTQFVYDLSLRFAHKDQSGAFIYSYKGANVFALCTTGWRVWSFERDDWTSASWDASITTKRIERIKRIVDGAIAAYQATNPPKQNKQNGQRP